MTLDDTELDRLKRSCRQYTLPRTDESSQVKGWIGGNTKIGPVLDRKWIDQEHMTKIVWRYRN